MKAPESVMMMMMMMMIGQLACVVPLVWWQSQLLLSLIQFCASFLTRAHRVSITDSAFTYHTSNALFPLHAPHIRICTCRSHVAPAPLTPTSLVFPFSQTAAVI